MNNYQLLRIGMLIILLSGCNVFSTKTEEPPVKEAAPIKTTIDLSSEEKEKSEEPKVSDQPILIEAEIAAHTGDNENYFTYEGNVPLKIALVNTGTETFLYTFRHADNETIVAQGMLKSDESFNKVFDELPEGDYVLFCVVADEEPPADIKLKVKVELLNETV
ncbi:hypothetical protein [Lysinibacillus sp. 38-6]|uniref:hypothetical protein n=1 Tax=Lysinibacillus sp. 38-6 TaxID=3385991 RepID=UPI0039089654